uniref:WAPL domain-containing protein n=1 Tax=Hydatigena taeniaeformis TaxID=6205 RepID=A0A0R3WVV0_HYDTA
LYTAGDKTKVSHESQERSSIQHALDDMNYLIDGLSDSNTTDTRCLSILSLANKCLTPATRDLVHAYGLLKQICANLHDAHTDYVSRLLTHFFKCLTYKKTFSLSFVPVSAYSLRF